MSSRQFLPRVRSTRFRKRACRRLPSPLQPTTDLASLPAGWTSSDSAFSCAGVAGGTTCQLPLTYAPTAAASGALTLRYTYLNNAGESKSGSLNIPYRATADDSILGTPSPTSLAVVTGTSTALTISFATNDGNPASALSVTSGAFGFIYTNDSGAVKTGTVSIPYAATP